MSTETQSYIFHGRTLTNSPIILDATNEQNWIRVSLSAVNCNACALASSYYDYDPFNFQFDDDFDIVIRATKALSTQINNPIHYGGSEAGWFTAKGKALIEKPCFTYFNLYDFGITGEEGMTGFLSVCGLPTDTSMRVLLLATAFLLINDAVIALEDQKESFAAHLLYQAGECITFVRLIDFDAIVEPEKLKQALKNALSERGSKAAQVKLDNDPKQKAKPKAHSLWKDWQSGKTLHKSKKAFCDYVVKTIPEIEAVKTIERWDIEWKKEQSK